MADRSGDLVVGVSVDTKPAEKGLKSFKNKASKGLKGIDDEAKKTGNGFSSLFSHKQVNSMVSQFGELKDSIGGLQQPLAISTGFLKKYYSALAIATSATVAFASSQAMIAKDLKKLSESTEVSIASLSSLGSALVRGGKDFDEVNDLIFDFTERLGDARSGNATFSETFRALGVDINQSVDSALEATIKSLSSMEDKQQSLFRGMELFSESYKGIVTEISTGTNILEKEGMFSEQFVNQSAELNREIKELQVELTRLSSEAVLPLVDSMTEVVSLFNETDLENSKLFQGFEAWVNHLSTTGFAIKSLLLDLGLLEEKSDLHLFEEMIATQSIESLEAQLNELTGAIETTRTRSQELRETWGDEAVGVGIPTLETGKYEKQYSDLVSRMMEMDEKRIALVDELNRKYAEPVPVPVDPSVAVVDGYEEQINILEQLFIANERRFAAEKVGNDQLEEAWERSEAIYNDMIAKREAATSVATPSIFESLFGVSFEDGSLEEKFNGALEATSIFGNQMMNFADSITEANIARDEAELDSWRKKEQSKMSSMVVSRRAMNRAQEKFAKEEQRREEEISKKRRKMQIADTWASALGSIPGIWGGYAQAFAPFGVAGQALTVSFGTATTGLVLASAAKQTSAMQSFSDGGIVQQEAGLPSVGDRHIVAVNPNEEILTEDDPRHRNNGGGGGGDVYLTIENFTGGDSELRNLEDKLIELQDAGRIKIF